VNLGSLRVIGKCPQKSHDPKMPDFLINIIIVFPVNM